MSLSIGMIIDERYHIDSRIGEGGMAEVYQATDVIEKKPVAIKIMRRILMDDPINLRRFKNETTIAAALNHPNIVKVLDQGTVEGRPYIVHEFCKGQILSAILDVRQSLPLKEAINYTMQLLAALNYAHMHNVVHRDIKPDNIFLLPDGSIKLGDFGIATAEGVNLHTIELTGKIVGSVLYMAPELGKGKMATNLSDIYAVGITLFELLTGHPPYEKDNAINTVLAHMNEKMPSPKKYYPNCPKEIERIIFKATMKKPTDRYHTAKEMYLDLEAFINTPNATKEKKNIFARLFGFK